MAQQQKKASIVNVGLPWDDDRLHTAGPMTPQKVKEGIDMINRLMAEHGFEKFTSIQASDRTGLDEFKAAIAKEKRDALFLGGGLKEGGPFDWFRKEVIAAAKEIQPDINVVQVSLMNGPQSIVDQAEEVERSLDS